MIELVISGGQDGADLGGWRAARESGLPCSGWMPKGFRTESGPKPEYAGLYGAKEHGSSDYQPRTRQNVIDADATILFGDYHSAGSKLAYRCFRDKIGERARRARDPGITYIRDGWIPVHRWPTGNTLNLQSADVARILLQTPHASVNIAGNRESSKPGIGEWVRAYMIEVFRLIAD